MNTREKWIFGIAALAAIWVLRQNPQPVGASSLQPFRGVSPLAIHPPKVPSAGSPVYLPFVQFQGTRLPIFLLGVYQPDVYLGDPQNVDTYIRGLETWAGLSRNIGQGHSLVGDFTSVHDPNANANVPLVLEALWAKGYTAFINLWANDTAAHIASGVIDADIRRWAQAYKGWIDRGGNRKAFIGPLQEMNGYWVPYGMQPADYAGAFRHVITIFEEEGVLRNRVRWTFAPNGYSEPPYAIKDYYPGNSWVDVIAFSAYNFGLCRTLPFPTWWQEPQEAFGPYITEIRQTVSSSKPIFIAETASDSRGGDKNGWLSRSYAYLVQNNVRGVFYFNMDKDQCDWAVYQPGGRQVPGYKDAAANSAYRYISPEILSNLTLPP